MLLDINSGKQSWWQDRHFCPSILPAWFWRDPEGSGCLQQLVLRLWPCANAQVHPKVPLASTNDLISLGPIFHMLYNGGNDALCLKGQRGKDFHPRGGYLPSFSSNQEENQTVQGPEWNSKAAFVAEMPLLPFARP